MAEKQEEITREDLQGSFRVKNVPYTVCLTSTDLSWKKTDGKGAETKVLVEDIVSVKTSTTKSKSGSVDCWIVCYAQRKAKNILRKALVTFDGDQAECKRWTDKIQQQLDTFTQRPKKTLVLVNPVSGRSRGVKEYQNKVAPLFAEANMHTDVKVSERPRHSLEIIEAYDLDSIDSVVMVGGDGMYHEVCNGLLNKMAKKANIDLNDPKMDFPVLDIPIGIIPCGTGNGVADCNYGCIDVETAALAIIIGKRNNGNVDTIHCAGKFVIFSVLLVGHGLWGQLIHKTEQNRQLGVFRYPLIMIKELVVKTCRPIGYKVQYKKMQESPDKPTNAPSKPTGETEKQPVESDKGAVDSDRGSAETDKGAEGANKDGAGTANKVKKEGEITTEIIDGEEWYCIEKDYVGVISFNINIFGGSALTVDDLFDTVTVLAMRPCSRMQMMTFFKRMITKDIYRALEFVDYLKSSEYKVTLTKPSDKSTENGIVEHLLDIDGEAVEIEQPEFTVRHFPRKLWLFANVGEDYCLSQVKKE